MQATTVDKPWGKFIQYTHNEQSTVKILVVEPKQTLSLQSHKNRDEIWIFLDDNLEMQLDDKILNPKAMEQVFIPRNSKHRLKSTQHQGRVLEISLGEFDEEDITRYEDEYGRA